LVINKNSDEIKRLFNNIEFSTIELKYCTKIDENNPLEKWRNHSHDFMELIYFIDGRAKIKIQDENVNLALYDIIAYPPNVSHQEFLDVRCRNAMICIGIAFECMNLMHNSFKLSDSQASMKWLFEQIYLEYNQKMKFNEEIINTYIKALLLNMKRSINNAESLDYKEDILNTTTHYIYDHYKDELSLQILADAAYISPSYLDRLFKNKIGTSPMKYLNLVRIDIAKKLLGSSNMSVSKISEQVGFSGPKYFSRIFKNITKETPSEFRKNCSKYT